MRDDSLTAEIKEYTPDTKYHEDNLERAKQNLAKLETMSHEEIQVIIDKSYEDSLNDYHRRVQEKQTIRDRYEDMIHQVESWSPPTDEHTGLKEFALDQLKGALDFDCGYMPTKPTKMTVEEYISTYTEYYNKDIEYHTKSIQKEIESVRKANEWNKALRDSFQSSGK